MKDQIRILGIDDCPFDKFKEKRTKIIGTVYRGGDYFDGVISTDIEIDGKDSTEKLNSMISSSKFYRQIKYILLDGIGVGGLNIIDIEELYNQTNIPVIIVMRKMPNKIRETLMDLGMDDKINLIDKAGKVKEIEGIYIQSIGAEEKEIREILNMTCTHSDLPEPIRAAHIIASGVKNGESRGRA
ncbi:MAG: DUF99 family protein [Nanobdellota archaeon]